MAPKLPKPRKVVSLVHALEQSLREPRKTGRKEPTRAEARGERRAAARGGRRRAPKRKAA